MKRNLVRTRRTKTGRKEISLRKNGDVKVEYIPQSSTIPRGKVLLADSAAAQSVLERTGSATVREGVEGVYAACHSFCMVRLRAAEIHPDDNKRIRKEKKLCIRAASSARNALTTLSKELGFQITEWNLKLDDKGKPVPGTGSVWFSISRVKDGIETEKAIRSMQGFVELIQGHTPTSSGSSDYMPLDHATRAKRMAADKADRLAKFAGATAYEKDMGGLPATKTPQEIDKDGMLVVASPKEGPQTLPNTSLKQKPGKVSATQADSVKGMREDLKLNYRMQGDKTSWMAAAIHDRIPHDGSVNVPTRVGIQSFHPGPKDLSKESLY